MLWKDDNSNDYSRSDNDLINKCLSGLTEKEKTMFEQYITKLKELFKETNETRCTHCKDKSWNNKDTRLHDGSKNNRGCCIRCAGNRGYYSTGNEDYYIFKIVEPYWVNDDDGFFDPIKMRCSLPRQVRSYTCLAYSCPDFENKEKSISWDRSHGLCNIIMFLRRVHSSRVSLKEELIKLGELSKKQMEDQS